MMNTIKIDPIVTKNVSFLVNPTSLISITLIKRLCNVITESVHVTDKNQI